MVNILLYKQCIHAQHPTLAVVGITRGIVPLPLFAAQVQFFLAVLRGIVVLPSEVKMIAEIKQDMEQCIAQGIEAKMYHALWDRQWTYNEELAELAGFKKLPRVMKQIFNHVIKLYMQNSLTYRSANYIAINDDEFKEISLSNTRISK